MALLYYINCGLALWHARAQYVTAIKICRNAAGNLQFVDTLKIDQILKIAA
jgi:hypothetical protein